MNTKTKKITKATFKSFIKKNDGNLFIKEFSRFDGMSDMVEQNINPKYHPQSSTNMALECTFGIAGVWLVGGSRDRFNAYSDGLYEGIEVYNCCGSFVVCILNKSKEVSVQEIMGKIKGDE